MLALLGRSRTQTLARVLSVVLLALHVFGQLGHHRQHHNASQTSTQATASCGLCTLSSSAVILPGAPVVEALVLVALLTSHDPATNLPVVSQPVQRASSRAPPFFS